MRLLIVVRAVVAGRCNEEDTASIRPLDGIGESLRKTASAPTVAHNVCTLGDSIINAGNCVRGLTERVEELQCHKPDIPGHSDMRPTPVGNCPDCAGTVATMPVGIYRITRAVHGIDTVNIVNKAVAIIVHTVAGNFTGIDPHIRGQVGVSVADARIDDCNNDVAVSGCGLPGSGCVDISSSNATVLTLVSQSPQPAITECRIAGKIVRPDNVIRFDVFEEPGRLKFSYAPG